MHFAGNFLHAAVSFQTEELQTDGSLSEPGMGTSDCQGLHCKTSVVKRLAEDPPPHPFNGSCACASGGNTQDQWITRAVSGAEKDLRLLPRQPSR